MSRFPKLDTAISAPTSSANAVPLRAGVEARRAIDAVAVEQRHCWHLQFDGPFDEGLRLGSALKKAEGAGGVQLDVSLRS